jgi:phosphopentomutase
VKAEYSVSTVGKIQDLFAGRGVTTNRTTTGNADGMQKTLAELDMLHKGLLMVNLIDFDMVFGHRNDALGFGQALEEFDAWLPQLFAMLHPDDLLLITADHGCDPTMPGSDHTREYVPVLAWSRSMLRGICLGERESFADVAATLADFYAIKTPLAGESFLSELSSCRSFSP